MQKHMSDMPPHAKSESRKNKYVTASGATTLELGGLGEGLRFAFLILKIPLDSLILNAFQKQNIRNKGNINVSPLDTFVNLVLEEP